jgi:hypothetical protein
MDVESSALAALEPTMGALNKFERFCALRAAQLNEAVSSRELPLAPTFLAC